MNAALDPAPAAEEQLLHAVRRADWRFLLPDPELGRVAYVAPHDDALVRALGLTAEQLDLSGEGPADVVVATGAGPGDVARLAGLVRPGGWLYAETAGGASPRWTRALRELGFDEVDAVWLWPDAARCKEMTSLQDAAAVRHALGRRDPGARLRPRAWAARALLSAGQLHRLVPSAAVLGRRPEVA